MSENLPNAVARVMRRIYAQRLTTTSGGNVSARDNDGEIWITASGTDKGEATADDVVCLGDVTSTLRPSSETPFHVAIYQARPDVRAIVHAHPTTLVTATLTKSVPDLRLIPAAHRICGDVAWTDYQTPGTEQLGACLADAAGRGANALLMENHGIVTLGDNLAEALRRFESLEFATRAIDRATSCDTASLTTAANADPLLLEKSLEHSVSETIPNELPKFFQRGYARQLLMNGMGSASIRSANHCIVTDGDVDFGGAPATVTLPISQSGNWHQRIYAAHSEVGAIFHSHPPWATALSLLDFDSIPCTIPESYIVLGETQFFDGTDVDRFVQEMSLTQPSAVMAHDGVVVLGRTVLEAFDRLEVLETTAESILLGYQYGTPRFLNQSQMDELPRSWPLRDSSS